jgi:hypothetical protein
MSAFAATVLISLCVSVPSPLIGRIFARSSGEIRRAYPQCVTQSRVPLALRCPMHLYKVPCSTLFIFDEVERVAGVIVEFTPQHDLAQVQPWLKQLVNGLVDQFGMPDHPKPVKGTVTWHWSHNRAVAEVKLAQEAHDMWRVTVAFAESRPPQANEVPGPKAFMPPPPPMR